MSLFEDDDGIDVFAKKEVKKPAPKQQASLFDDDEDELGALVVGKKAAPKNPSTSPATTTIVTKPKEPSTASKPTAPAKDEKKKPPSVPASLFDDDGEDDLFKKPNPKTATKKDADTKSIDSLSKSTENSPATSRKRTDSQPKSPATTRATTKTTTVKNTPPGSPKVATKESTYEERAAARKARRENSKGDITETSSPLTATPGSPKMTAPGSPKPTTTTTQTTTTAPKSTLDPSKLKTVPPESPAAERRRLREERRKELEKQIKEIEEQEKKIEAAKKDRAVKKTARDEAPKIEVPSVSSEILSPSSDTPASRIGGDLPPLKIQEEEDVSPFTPEPKEEPKKEEAKKEEPRKEEKVKQEEPAPLKAAISSPPRETTPALDDVDISSVPMRRATVADRPPVANRPSKEEVLQRRASIGDRPPVASKPSKESVKPLSSQGSNDSILSKSTQDITDLEREGPSLHHPTLDRPRAPSHSRKSRPNRDQIIKDKEDQEKQESSQLARGDDEESEPQAKPPAQVIMPRQGSGPLSSDEKPQIVAKKPVVGNRTNEMVNMQAELAKKLSKASVGSEDKKTPPLEPVSSKPSIEAKPSVEAPKPVIEKKPSIESPKPVSEKKPSAEVVGPSSDALHLALHPHDNIIKAELEKEKAAHEAAKADLHHSREENTKLHNEARNLRTEISSLSKQKESLSGELTTLKDSVRSLEAKNAEAKATIDAQAKEIAALKAAQGAKEVAKGEDVGKLEALNFKLKHDLNEKNSEINSLQAQIRSLKAELQEQKDSMKLLVDEAKSPEPSPKKEAPSSPLASRWPGAGNRLSLSINPEPTSPLEKEPSSPTKPSDVPERRATVFANNNRRSMVVGDDEVPTPASSDGPFGPRVRATTEVVRPTRPSESDDDKKAGWKAPAAPTDSSKCAVCGKTVYAVEKLVADNVTYHKTCFRCAECNKTLSVGNYAGLNGKTFCKPHFKQLFALKGNYDGGFGTEPHKMKWLQSPSGESSDA